MKNLAQNGFLVTSLSLLSACSVQAVNEEPVETIAQDLTLTSLRTSVVAAPSLSTSAKVVSAERLKETPALPAEKRPSISFAGAELKLAALAHHVIACRGAVSGGDFGASGETIVPRFVGFNLKTGFVTLPNKAIVQFTAPGKTLAIRGDIEKGALMACPAAEEADAALIALSAVVNLVAVQKFDRTMGAFWAKSWGQAVPASECPAWHHAGTASGDPLLEETLQKGSTSTKTTEYFKVDGDVELALACAAGYGDAFIVSLNGNLIETDPAYWEDTRNFGYSNSPYLKAEPNGYMHNMKAYNDSFAAIQRVGEKCRDPILEGVLRENNCSDDPAYPWICNSICL